MEAVLADIQRRGVDRAICLGDITLKGPLPKPCVDRVRDMGCPVVLGNTDGCYHPDFHPVNFPAQNESHLALQRDFDRQVAALSEADRAWLQGFPLTHTEVVEGRRMDFFHAVPHHNYVMVTPWAENDAMAAQRLADETWLSAYGHTHRSVVRHPKGRVVLNPGSVGIPFDGDPRPGYALVDVEAGATAVSLIRVEYDAEAAIQAARDVGMHGWELFAHTARTGRFPG